MVIDLPVATPPHPPVLSIPHAHRILVVDDNPDLANTVMWSLEMLGHTVCTALDGPSALATARSFHPDIVFLDIGIPVMNGYEICQAMRDDPLLKDIFIVAQTGWGQKEHFARTKEAGFDEHLVKPVSIQLLENTILTLEQNAPRRVA